MIDRLIDVWLEKVPHTIWLLMGTRQWCRARPARWLAPPDELVERGRATTV